jgi:hypothetical protein
MIKDILQLSDYFYSYEYLLWSQKRISVNLLAEKLLDQSLRQEAFLWYRVKNEREKHYRPAGAPQLDLTRVDETMSPFESEAAENYWCFLPSAQEVDQGYIWAIMGSAFSSQVFYLSCLMWSGPSPEIEVFETGFQGTKLKSINIRGAGKEYVSILNAYQELNHIQLPLRDLPFYPIKEDYSKI